MTIHSALARIGYVTTDLDDYAAALADLAEAIRCRKSADVLGHVERIGACDPPTAAALTDWLIFTEMFEEVTS
ncbi:hypothetical protein [Phytohabitans houttuyneae]|uniref:Uncharacterized protein n=1 Tax=Phytohabitans houttuyneae TaxID=1076126 RepID=A0A6V8K3S6_9ACTN|nr:hypothetical protein [Phytohabitans houttuyneae]GFJ79803.1 hypothetical protein Phou_039830 [Phytohabitans houttuyneae]